MTSNKEDYLKAIYDAGGFDSYVPNKVIAEKLGVAPASVSEMLSKMQNDGLIRCQAYHGSKLTKDGLDACISVVRSHQLWEVFLMRHLGYSWWEAHEEAHLLEHASSVKMIDRLDEFLGYPETCPHGALIPRKGKPVPRWTVPLQKLSDLETGAQAEIVQISEDQALLDYLERSGIQIGKQVKVIAKDEYEGPVSFDQEGQLIQISYKASTKIFVQLKK